MKPISILNDVLGPVMRGPSSSHTAGPFHIGSLARALLGEEPAAVTLVFDPAGSFAQVYREQGSDLGFAAGLLGWAITDARFPRALDLAAERGLRIAFLVEPLPEADHPNAVEIRMASASGSTLRALAKSIGGGAVVFTRVQDWPVHLTGDAYDVLVEAARAAEPSAAGLLARDGQALGPLERQERGDKVLLHSRRPVALDTDVRARITTFDGVANLWEVSPIFFLQRGPPLLASAAEMAARAEEQGWSLGQVALAYETALLRLGEQEVLDEVERRFQVMRAAVQRGLGEELDMQLLQPSASQILRAEANRRLAVGGIHTRAAARAMAVMHVNSSMGVVCAAPTAGSAGVIPGALVTLAEERGLGGEQVALALLAASAVGLVVGTRATFAAETAGCQVEIGAAGAMAAAAVVEAAGGSAGQALDAAAICLQNSMGSPCDLVQGIVEIPCHTRNAAAAASAFVCADLVLGGYDNPIPLDETVDAAYAVGQMLPREIRCTALAGLSQAPSARAIPRRRSH